MSISYHLFNKATILAPLLLSASVHASYTTTEPVVIPQDKAGNKEQVSNAYAVLPRVGTNETQILPTRKAVSNSVQPGLTEGEDWLQILSDTLDENMTPSKLAEGAFIQQRTGQIIKTPRGNMVFVPNKAERTPGEGPVLLMPCRTLERLELQWNDQKITLSGEIFTYHQRNQLLISDFRILSSSTSTPPSSDSHDSTEQTEEPNEPASMEDDPAVQDLLNELNFESQTTPQRRRNHTLDSGSPVSTLHDPREQEIVEDVVSGYAEGDLLIRQPSRLVRNASGAWSIVFDNDDMDASHSPEMIVLPCNLLMQMERIAMNSGDEQQMLISGRIYTHQDTHYVLPTLFQRVRAGELNSLQ